jgi:hypothetical protein
VDPAFQDHEIQPSVHTLYVVINETQSLGLNLALGSHFAVIQSLKMSLE